MVKKVEKDARRNWDVFYKKNETRFFKDRHWLDQEFGDDDIDPVARTTFTTNSALFELGCGVGNALYPLLETYPDLKAHCCDFSARAIDFVRQHPNHDPTRVHAFVWDLTTPDEPGPPLAQQVRSDLQPTTPPDGEVAPGAKQPRRIGTPTVVSMIFVLSAIPPRDQKDVLKRVVSCFDPAVGGTVLFRDYAIGDMAQLRFDSKDSNGPKYYEPARLDSEEPYYRRGDDGTLAYFFDPDYLASLAEQVGLQGPRPTIQERIVVNRKQESTMVRRFVQAQWTVPPQAQSSA